MCEITKLLRLLQAVPIMHVDEAAARARGDHEAVRYARAIRDWQAVAARALDESAQEPAQRRDAFARVAVASELLRLPVANRNDAASRPV